MKKQLILVFSLILFSINLIGQTKTFDPDEILVGNRKLPSILCIGTFHFGYPNQDVVKTNENMQVDILTAKKQAEIEQLVDYIALFKPNKIVIEVQPEEKRLSRIVDKYKKVKNGTQKAGRDEVEQIAFRLMAKFKLDTLYGGDAPSIFDELYYSKDSVILRPTLDKIFSGYQNYNYKCTDPVCVLQDSVVNKEADMELKWSLIDYFRYLNSDKALNRNYGGYFNNEYFKQGQYRGADALAMDWYNRNLRIYRNIQRVTTSPNDRILVLFGQGHVAILKQLISSDPNYKPVKFNDLK
ncbi:MAG: DUF5694 domain-containing protein [Emticicia sp.]|nr:DUF5694 domain-containing protein [Emticicia sp.]